MTTSRIAIVLAVAAVAIGCSEGARAGARPAPATVAVPAAVPVTTNAPPPATTPAPPRGPAAPSKLLGPFTIDSIAYTVELVRYLVGEDTSVSRVLIKDSAAHVVYAEDLAPLMDPDPGSGIEAWSSLLEDAAGRPRALLLDYGVFPSAPGTGETTRLVAPRGGQLQVITPVQLDYGDVTALPAGRQPGSRRLLEGNRLIVRDLLDHFGIRIPVVLDLDCAVDADGCVTLARTDSVGGLSLLEVSASPREIEEAVSVPLFAGPDSTAMPQQVSLAEGSKIEVLRGAARVRLRRDGKHRHLDIDDVWLQIRANGKIGWIHGEERFGQIGLSQIG